MSVFCDSSALVKLYADERGADAVRGLQAIVASELARVEVPAALWRKRRVGELEPHEAAALVAEFEADWFELGRFGVVDVSDDIFDAAARQLARHPLRAYDAVQLASAIAVRDKHQELGRFVCFDRDLAAAAAAEGFAP